MKKYSLALVVSLVTASSAMATLPELVVNTPVFEAGTNLLTIPYLGIKGSKTVVKDVAVRILNAEVVSAGASVLPPDWMAGTWVGIGNQSSGSTWSIEANNTNATFTIAYPSLNCSGRWDLLSADSSRAIFTEVITAGIFNCVETGRVVVTRIDNNYVTFSYWRQSGDLLTSWSTLTKKRVAP